MNNIFNNIPNFTKTIYSIPFPITKSTLKDVLRDELFLHNYEETWTKKQDKLHQPLFDSFAQWVSPRLICDFSSYKHQYPTNGSSEAIREQICYLHSLGKRLVVFDSEYEGYISIANSIGMPIIKINRFQSFYELEKQIKLLNPDTDIFFISEPSSIDGNSWSYFDLFMNLIEKLNIKVYIDLAYIGMFNFSKKINLNYSNIDGIFFSLSKIFGVYYHRIGGVFLKDSNPLLFGNIWFKNILSIHYGISLMNNTKIGFFDNQLKEIQQKIILNLQNQYGIEFVASDVFLIINTQYNENDHPWQKEYQRSILNKKLRLCISALIENELKHI